MYILTEVGGHEYNQTIINVIDLMEVLILILKTILMVLEVLMIIANQINLISDGIIAKIQKQVQILDSLRLLT